MADKTARKNILTDTEKTAKTFQNKLRRAQRRANQFDQIVKIKKGSDWIEVKPNK